MLPRHMEMFLLRATKINQSNRIGMVVAIKNTEFSQKNIPIVLTLDAIGIIIYTEVSSRIFRVLKYMGDAYEFR